MYVLFCYGVYGYYDTYNEALEVFKILEKKDIKKLYQLKKWRTKNGYNIKKHTNQEAS